MDSSKIQRVQVFVRIRRFRLPASGFRKPSHSTRVVLLQDRHLLRNDSLDGFSRVEEFEIAYTSGASWKAGVHSETPSRINSCYAFGTNGLSRCARYIGCSQLASSLFQLKAEHQSLRTRPKLGILLSTNGRRGWPAATTSRSSSSTARARRI